MTSMVFWRLVTQAAPSQRLLAVPLSAIKTMAVQARPANGKARIACEQELLFLTRCHPRSGCSFSFASERQGQGWLLLVVSRGRCHVDEGMPSCSRPCASTE